MTTLTYEQARAVERELHAAVEQARAEMYASAYRIACTLTYGPDRTDAEIAKFTLLKATYEAVYEVYLAAVDDSEAAYRAEVAS
jgi:predicted trehalose synthase